MNKLFGIDYKNVGSFLFRHIRKMNLTLFLVSVLSCFFVTDAINGGTLALSGDFKYFVVIVNKEWVLLKSTCGGAIIHEKFVLSAAHCFTSPSKKNPDGTYTQKFDKPSVTVYANTLDLDHTKAPTISRKGKKVYLVPNYMKHGGTADIAVLELTEKFNLAHNSRYLQSLELPKRISHNHFETYKDKIAEFAGFGTDHQNKKTEKKLKDTHVKIIDPYFCKRAYSRLTKDTPDDEIICGNTVEMKPNQRGTLVPKKPDHKLGPCEGDSGGPLVHGNTVIGVLSFGSSDCDDRGDYPGVYVRVSHHEKFISDVIDQHIDENEIEEHHL